MSDLDRVPEPWHKLHPDEYETAVAESVGAMVGTCMGLGEDAPRITDAFHKGLRAMAASAFDRGYQTNRNEDHDCLPIAEAEARGYQRAIDALRDQVAYLEWAQSVRRNDGYWPLGWENAAAYLASAHTAIRSGESSDE